MYSMRELKSSKYLVNMDNLTISRKELQNDL